MSLMLLGYISIVCNVLLAWATLHQPYISTPKQTLSLPPPQNKNKWVHLVIFEPQPKIQLTWSSYKVMSFLDFQFFLEGFHSVNKYLVNLIGDINNPIYFQKLISQFGDTHITPLSNESSISKFLNSPACVHAPFACQSKMKCEQFHVEIDYMFKVFHAVFKKFLTAIDHIDYHPSQKQNTTGVKRSVMYSLYGHYHAQTRMLTPSEEKFLDQFLKALNKINPSLCNSLAHMKRISIFTWILGWGVYSNARSISKIKDNLHTLQKQNQLQDEQIKHLAKFLNLTVHQVSKHSEMLYEMDTKMFVINKTLHHIMWNIDDLHYESNMLHYFQTRIHRVHTSLYALRGDTKSLYEYMRTLASQELNPMIIPPAILKKIFIELKMISEPMLDSNCMKILKPIFSHIMEQLN